MDTGALVIAAVVGLVAFVIVCVVGLPWIDRGWR